MGEELRSKVKEEEYELWEELLDDYEHGVSAFRRARREAEQVDKIQELMDQVKMPTLTPPSTWQRRRMPVSNALQNQDESFDALSGFFCLMVFFLFFAAFYVFRRLNQSTKLVQSPRVSSRNMLR